MQTEQILDSILAMDSAGVRATLDAGVSPSAEVAGQPLLHWALSVRAEDIFELLVSLGADVNGVGIEGESVLMVAAYQAMTSSISLLLRADANVNYVDGAGRTALMYGARSGDCESVEILLGSGASVAVVDQHGCNAAHWAMLDADNVAVLALLIERGVPLVAADSGPQPVHLAYAEKLGRQRCAQLLRSMQ